MSGSSLFYGGKKCAYVPTIKSWGQKKKLTVSKKNAKAGDIVIFNFGGKSKADHIGLIVKNVGKGKSFKTIEGNTSSLGSQDNGGAVLVKSRSASLVSCIIRPEWNKTYCARNFVSLAKKQVGTKENPKNSNIVKYSKEYGFYGPWCCMFIWWLFKHMEKNTPSTYPTLKKGTKSKWVIKAKKLLAKKGYKSLLNLKSKTYGNGTVKAVKKFQKKNGLTVDGVIGSKTWVKLCK